jgi:hypothetical protein
VGSKGKMKLGADPGSSAHVAVPPFWGVPPVGTEVPWPLVELGVVVEEHAARTRAAVIATAAMENMARVGLTLPPLSCR